MTLYPKKPLALGEIKTLPPVTEPPILKDPNVITIPLGRTHDGNFLALTQKACEFLDPTDVEVSVEPLSMATELPKTLQVRLLGDEGFEVGVLPDKPLAKVRWNRTSGQYHVAVVGKIPTKARLWVRVTRVASTRLNTVG